MHTEAVKNDLSLNMQDIAGAIQVQHGNELTAETAIKAALIWVNAAIVMQQRGDKNEVGKLLASETSDTVPLTTGPWLDVKVLESNVHTLAALVDAQYP